MAAKTGTQFYLDQPDIRRIDEILIIAMSEIFGFDTYSPEEIAERVESVGVAKARQPLLSMVMLGMLASAFIGLGALCLAKLK